MSDAPEEQEKKPAFRPAEFLGAAAIHGLQDGLAWRLEHKAHSAHPHLPEMDDLPVHPWDARDRAQHSATSKLSPLLGMGTAVPTVAIRALAGEGRLSSAAPYLVESLHAAPGLIGLLAMRNAGAKSHAPEVVKSTSRGAAAVAGARLLAHGLNAFKNDLATRPIARMSDSYRERRRARLDSAPVTEEATPEEKTAMQTRSGKTPLTILNLAKKTHVPPGMKLSFLSETVPGYAGPMTAFRSTAEEAGFMQGFAEELQKIAADLDLSDPLAHFSNNPDAYAELFKQAGFLDALKGYGRNIASYARNARDTMTGGNYARQMKELGSASPMSTSASAGKVVGNQQGPMRDLVAQRADAASLQASLNPASWGLPSQAPAIHPSSAAWGLNFQAPGGAAGGASRMMATRGAGSPLAATRVPAGSRPAIAFALPVP